MTDPKLKPERVDAIYEELAKLEIELDADPLAYGPKRLNGKIALARKMLARCEEIFLQVSHDLHRFSRAKRLADAELKLRKDDLFANDPHVRAGRNVADREALAAVKLKPQVERTFELDAGCEELKGALVVVKAKRTDLWDAAGRLRDQIRLCQEEIVLGSQWGSKVPHAPDIKPSGKPDTSVIDDIVASAGDETHLPQQDDEDWRTDDAYSSPVDPAKAGSDDDGAISAPLPPVEPEPEPDPAPEPAKGTVYKATADEKGEPVTEPVLQDGAADQDAGDTSLVDEPDLDPELGTAEDVLPATASDDEVAAFLAGDDEPTPAERKAKAQEQLDTDLEDLLSVFGGG
jgi:hypothetical protein